MKAVRILCAAAFSLLLFSAVLAVEKADQPRQDAIYTCNCGPDCHCNSASKESGNCTCGKPMKWGHVVKIEGDEALVCTCEEWCNCSLDPKDPTKCGCGKPVKRVSLKGTGLHFCNCGGSCACNVISDKAGTCKCGMDLKKVD